MFERHTYHVEAIKRDGRHVVGTATWDGLSAIMAVQTAYGIVYVSELDNILTREQAS